MSASRIGAAKIGVAIGTDDEDSGRFGRSDQMAQHQEGRFRGPLQVVEHERIGARCEAFENSLETASNNRYCSVSGSAGMGSGSPGHHGGGLRARYRVSSPANGPRSTRYELIGECMT